MGRSFLFIPGTYEKYILKINSVKTDKIIIDLEDSINIRDLNLAYKLIKKHKELLKKNKVFARIPKNLCDHKTISFSVANGVNGLVIPKIFKISELKKIINVLKNIQKKLYLILLAETAYSIVYLNDLIKLSSNFYGIMFGHEDYSLDIKIFEGKNKNKFTYAREKIVAVCNANNLIPIESPFLSVKDKEGFRKYLKNSKEIGFKGVICLSPTQCEIANKSFLPDYKSYQLSKKIINIIKTNKNKKNIIYKDSIFVGPPIIKQSKIIIKAYEEYKNQKK